MVDTPTYFTWNKYGNDYETVRKTGKMATLVTQQTVCIAEHKEQHRQRITNNYDNVDRLAGYQEDQLKRQMIKWEIEGKWAKVGQYKAKLAKLQDKAGKAEARVKKLYNLLHKLDICNHPLVLYGEIDEDKLRNVLKTVKGAYYSDMLQERGWSGRAGTRVIYFEDANQVLLVKLAV